MMDIFFCFQLKFFIKFPSISTQQTKSLGKKAQYSFSIEIQISGSLEIPNLFEKDGIYTRFEAENVTPSEVGAAAQTCVQV